MISRHTEETNPISDHTKTTTATSWSRLKDPRIVRVSRALGGKDRHSKVCTVRGLRDRRVRLSVPTAIQLYDLQERLGLNQPSKVVDWLLDAAKHEIDELPPLQIPQDIMLNSHHFLNKGGKVKDCEGETSERNGDEFDVASDFLHQNTSSSSSSFTRLLRWDASSLSLGSHAPIRIGLNDQSHHHQQQQHEDLHNFGVVYHQSGMMTQSFYAPQIAAAAANAFSFNIEADRQQLKRDELGSP